MSENYTPEFKARIVLQALKARETDTSIAQAYGVHPVTLSRWKKQLERNASTIFGGGDDAEDDLASELAGLKEQAERFRAEVAIMRSVFDQHADIDTKVRLVNEFKDQFGLNAVCEIVDLPKSTYYYRMADD